MGIQGLDVSHYQPSLPWPQFAAAGQSFAIVKASESTWVDSMLSVHTLGAKSAGLEVGHYHFLRPGNGADQAHAFNGAAYVGDSLMFGLPRYWVDVEAGTNMAATLAAFLDEWHTLRPAAAIGIYTGQGLWASVVGNEHTEFGAYPLWNGSIPLPAGWSHCVIQQNPVPGHLLGYAGALDLDEIPGATMPTIEPQLTGCLIGGGAESNSDIIPIYTALAKAGAVPPIIIGVENPGLCVDAKALGVPTTIARFLHPESGPDHDFEGGGDGRGGWSQEKRLRFARASIALAFNHMNPAEAAAVDFVQCAGNEWDAQDVGEWLATCDVWSLVLDERDNRQAEYVYKNGKPLRLAMGIFNAGTPKTWPMYQAIFSHPVFGRMHAAGDFIGFHEGVAFGQPKDYLYDVPLDAAPPIEGSGLVNFRSDYALAVLDSHGWAMPYGFLEWYDGFKRTNDVGPRIEALQWVDTHMGTAEPATRKYFRGYCCFELTNDPASSWYGQDFTPVFRDPRWTAYAVSQKGRKNGDTEMPILYHAKALLDLVIRDAAGLPTTDPVGVPPAQPGMAGVVKTSTLVHVYAEGVTAGGYNNRVTINPNGANVWAVATALVKV